MISPEAAASPLQATKPQQLSEYPASLLPDFKSFKMNPSELCLKFFSPSTAKRELMNENHEVSFPIGGLVVEVTVAVHIPV